MQTDLKTQISSFFQKSSKVHKELYELYKINEFWGKILPKNFEQQDIAPLKILPCAHKTHHQNRGNSKALLIAVTNTSLSSQLYYYKDEILFNIAHFLGIRNIASLKIQVIHKKQKQQEAMQQATYQKPSEKTINLIKNIEDEAIKAGLLKLADKLR